MATILYFCAITVKEKNFKNQHPESKKQTKPTSIYTPQKTLCKYCKDELTKSRNIPDTQNMIY